MCMNLHLQAKCPNPLSLMTPSLTLLITTSGASLSHLPLPCLWYWPHFKRYGHMHLKSRTPMDGCSKALALMKRSIVVSPLTYKHICRLFLGHSCDDRQEPASQIFSSEGVLQALENVLAFHVAFPGKCPLYGIQEHTPLHPNPNPVREDTRHHWWPGQIWPWTHYLWRYCAGVAGGIRPPPGHEAHKCETRDLFI